MLIVLPMKIAEESRAPMCILAILLGEVDSPPRRSRLMRQRGGRSAVKARTARA